MARKITVTQALVELKLYDKKIMDAIAKGQYVGAVAKSATKIGAVSRSNFDINAKASYVSVTNLMKNRSELKSAIVKSNAITEVTINGKTMTVAEAIERKNSIAYDEQFLNELQLQYGAAVAMVATENKRVDKKVDELIQTLVGKDTTKKLAAEDQEAVERPYREKHEYELQDPLGLEEIINTMKADIDGFKAECDVKLSVANSVTYIDLGF